MAERKQKDDHSVAKTVLVVDDDWLIREVIALALDDAGW
jgi:CheY-like chemotaxis protein